MKRRPIIAGNWKMNCTIGESVQLATALKRMIFEETWPDVVVCPPFTSISAVAEITEGTEIKVGAQDMFWEEKGAYTGEVSASMIKDAGCSYVIIGHSERRHYFGETNAGVNRKVKSALSAGLIPIVCTGETKEERENGLTHKVVEEHIKEGFKGIGGEDILKCIIAYEPVWAIGTGLTAAAGQAEEVHNFIRNGLLAPMYGDSIASGVRLQYGGSVNPANIAGLMKEPDIDGALVGGASLRADSFIEIISSCGR